MLDRCSGRKKDDYASGVATDLNKNVYIAGETYGSLDGTNYAGYDASVAKYSGC
jgi:Beta-propeller repeat